MLKLFIKYLQRWRCSKGALVKLKPHDLLAPGICQINLIFPEDATPEQPEMKRFFVWGSWMWHLICLPLTFVSPSSPAVRMGETLRRVPRDFSHLCLI